MCTCGTCARVARVARACSGAYRMARVRARALMEARVLCGERYGGAWGRVTGFLDLKFSGFVVLRPYKTPVGSVL